MENIIIQKTKELIQKEDISYREFAHKIGITEFKMTRCMMGAHPISIEDLVKFAKGLNTTTDYLLGLSDQSTKYNVSNVLKEYKTLIKDYEDDGYSFHISHKVEDLIRKGGADERY